MQALTLDLSKLSEMSEQSLMWRSKPSQSATWLRRWKTDLLTQRLYGRILKPSLGNSLIKKWTSSVAASLVSHSVRQEEEKVTKTQDTCGHISQKAFNSLESLPLFSWKTLKESSVQNSKATNGPTPKTHPFCFMCSESWKDWAIKQRRAYSQRVKLVHHISVNESLYLVSEMNSQKKVVIGSADLLSQIEQNQEQPGRHLETKNSIGMNRQGLRWTTPTAREWKGHFSKKRQENTNKKKKVYLADQAHGETYRGKLNPRWVEMLMGIPLGWTMPSCLNPVTIEQMNLDYLEMELCQTQRLEHLEPCGKNWSTWMTPGANDFKQITLGKKALNHRKEKGSQFMLPTQVHEIEMLKQDYVLQNNLDYET